MSRGRPAPKGRTSGAQWLVGIVAALAIARWGWLGALGLAVLYAAVCWWWPIATCGRCDGSGRVYAPWGRAHRPCPRCDGNGGHVRFAARFWHSASG